MQKGQISGCSIQWMQWNSGIWWWAHCLWRRKVKPVDTVDAVYAKNSDMYTGDGANAGDAVNSEYYVIFMHQRQCPHHIPLFHCVHFILRPHHGVTFV